MTSCDRKKNQKRHDGCLTLKISRFTDFSFIFQEYKAIQKQVGEFYFGPGVVQPTPENLNIYVQMNTDTNWVYPIYEAMRMHSSQAKTFCYQ